MGPSQVSFLLLTIIACSYAMLPNQGFFGAGGSTSGMAGLTGSMSGMSGSMAGMSGSMAGSMGGAMGGARTGGMMALQYQMYDRKRSIMKNLIQLYERHGCIDPMQKFSSEFIPAAITMISGCADSRANFSCRAYGMQKLNFQTVMMQRAMPPQQIDMFAARFNQMSPYNSLQNTLLAQGPLNPLALRFAYGNEGPGSGPAFAGEQLDRIRNMRIAYLPYQCQGIKAWNLEMGLCCPGPVSFDPQVEMRVLADFIHV